ncbi:hypothetical protein GGI03_004309 [Coemansia sp. RSA 2337]|nr:hypothetical protein H4S03_007817 [Coemansia sp. S3946]KAJ2431025.1 hypothetical protein GGF41_000733 [Coemansia sp. RSA 2531]KAJ2462702.1 hypothetical protein GGI03_004309 [Coemansia sp. RSA 2337]
MNVTTPEGWHAFIELLVNWSMCEDSQLGCNLTIVHLPDLDCWQIDCPNDTSHSIGTKPWHYYFNEVICHADHLFGRHTCCFLATDTKPAVSSLLVPSVVIKDAWVFAKPSTDKDVHDEIKTLKKIRVTLGEHIKPKDDIIYLEIVVGGRVSFKPGHARIQDNFDDDCHGLK